MHCIREAIARFALEEDPVLITGESGTGKRIVANALHDASRRRGKVMVVACLAGVGEMARAAICGHKRGAFTGATESHDGYLRQGHGSSVLFDDIPDLPADVQAILLRAIEEKAFRPVGGEVDEYSDARILATTNLSVRELIAKGNFRRDLFHRLNVLTINLPPLREHKEDIALLVGSFLSRGRRPGQKARTLSPAAMAYLHEYSWPGNVRELENVIRHATVCSEELEIQRDQIRRIIEDDVVCTKEALEDADPITADLLRNTLIQVKWKKRKAARRLNISPDKLYRTMKKHGIPLDRPTEME